MATCGAYLRCLLAMPICSAYLRCLLAMPICGAYFWWGSKCCVGVTVGPDEFGDAKPGVLHEGQGLRVQTSLPYLHGQDRRPAGRQPLVRCHGDGRRPGVRDRSGKRE